MWLVATPHSADMHSPASSGAPLRIVGEANLSSVSRVTHQGVGGLVALLPRALAFGALLATFEVLAGALSERGALVSAPLACFPWGVSRPFTFAPGMALQSNRRCEELFFDLRVLRHFQKCFHQGSGALIGPLDGLLPELVLIGEKDLPRRADWGLLTPPFPACEGTGIFIK